MIIVIGEMVYVAVIDSVMMIEVVAVDSVQVTHHLGILNIISTTTTLPSCSIPTP